MCLDQKFWALSSCSLEFRNTTCGSCDRLSVIRAQFEGKDSAWCCRVSHGCAKNQRADRKTSFKKGGPQKFLSLNGFEASQHKLRINRAAPGMPGLILGGGGVNYKAFGTRL
ncbi:hypothetical protein CDAR_413131, partial [Caerostris darwini]